MRLLVASSRLIVSWSGEALASRLISAGSGWAVVPVMPSRSRCLLALMPSGMGAMPFSSSAFPPAPYHHMAAGRVAVRRPPPPPIWLIVACFLVPGAVALASCRSFDSRRTGREAGGGLLGYRGVAHHASSMNVYNEYDVCDLYKRYKDTRIREYDGYMWRCG